MTVFRSQISVTSEDYLTNRKGMLDLIDKLRELEGRAVAASSRSDAKFESRGQLPPRERLARVLDPGAPWLELQSLAGYAVADNGAPAEREGSIPGGNHLSGIGFVSGTRCVVLVTDSGISAGAYSASALTKIIRAQDVALANRLPLLHLVESAGANLPGYRVEGFAVSGRVFANLARLSAAGIPVITVLHGSSTAGGAYMPGLSDVVIGVKGHGKAFLAGPPLLRAATGEIATASELGGATMHADVSGLVEYLAEDDADAIRLAREVVGRIKWGFGQLAPPPREFDDPMYDPDELAGVVPVDYKTPVDVRELLARLVDGSDFSDFKSRYGAATVCVEAAVHGYPVALIGNNGPIDNEGATKAAHFIQHCNQIGMPIAYLQNTTGFMVGTEVERRGIIKHGSKMLQAVANSQVPQFTFMTGASYGAGNYGMCGRGLDPRFLFAWPNASMGVMGPEQAGMVMRIVAEAGAERRGKPIPEEQLAAEEAKVASLLASQQDAFYVSGRLVDDGVIDPRHTRSVLAFLLATAAESTQIDLHPLNFGVARM